jgi:hypothetical protein
MIFMSVARPRNLQSPIDAAQPQRPAGLAAVIVIPRATLRLSNVDYLPIPTDPYLAPGGSGRGPSSLGGASSGVGVHGSSDNPQARTCVARPI